jgi:hypothetical protein
MSVIWIHPVLEVTVVLSGPDLALFAALQVVLDHIVEGLLRD